MWLLSSQYDANDLCVICQEPYGNKRVVYQLPCTHIFHADCLHRMCEHRNIGQLNYQYQPMQCPLCKSEFSSEDCINIDQFMQRKLNPTAKTRNGRKQRVIPMNKTIVIEGGRTRRTKTMNKRKQRGSKRKRNRKRQTKRPF